MDKQIRTVDQQKGIVQITTVDSRWYARPATDPVTGLPRYEYVPACTWICDYYPKGQAFWRWLAEKGWNEAEAIKVAAGDKGSKVHQASGDLLDGKMVAMEASYLNNTTGQPEPLSLEEYGCLMSFVAWAKEAKPMVVNREFVVWNDQDGYAGTVDLLCLVHGERWLIDLKTSQHVWPSHELQVSAYKHALPAVTYTGDTKLGILQLGYRRNKAGWKFTEVADQYPLFLAAKQIWSKETAGQVPAQKDYPLSLMLAPAAPPVADAVPGPTTGGVDGAHRGGAEKGGLREGRGGRVVGGVHRGSPVRRGQGVQVKKQGH